MFIGWVTRRARPQTLSCFFLKAILIGGRRRLKKFVPDVPSFWSVLSMLKSIRFVKGFGAG